MPRPLKNPLMEAVENILLAIPVGTGTMPVGREEAPDCGPPYLILSAGSGGTFSGPWTDNDADAEERVQVTGVGTKAVQATWALDKAREALTFSALVDEGIAGRKILSVDLDVSRGQLVEQRGLPNPLFSDIDQYLIMTTPG